jgi:hypothetical protein
VAKNSDQRAGGFEAENTGGVLSGLLAEEEHLDRRAMFRLGTWGVVSVGAVVVAVLANQSTMRSRRDEIAALDLTRQSQQIQSVAKESQNETRRLASAIDTLNSDRDRMYSRLTSLEQGLESVTGAIARQNAPPPAAPSPAATSPAATPTAATQPVAQSTAPEPAPVIAPVMTVAAAVPATDKSASERSRTESKKSTQAHPAPVAAATPAPSEVSPATSAAPLTASKSMMGPPDPAAGKLIESKSIEPKSTEPETPARPVAAATPAPATPVPATPVAAIPVPPAPASATAAPTTPAPTIPAAETSAPMPSQASTPEAAPEVAAAPPATDKSAAEKPAADKRDRPDAATAPQLAVKRTEFGVDVGGANSVGGLRALWRGLLKWRSNAALAGLQPIIVVKESNNGLGMQLRLVAGPLTDAASAARICASMTVNDRHCETTVYDGQRLALRAEDMPTTTESISAKPSAEKPSPDKPSEAAEEKSASDKPSARPGNRQSAHRHYSYSKRSAPVVETPPPPPPQTSSLSWFRLRSQ